MINTVPYQPDPITTADATDLSTAITLVNDIKEKYNNMALILFFLISELNTVSGKADKKEEV
jgi:hypothetical protein